MQKKKFKQIERKPRLRCPNCGERICREMTAKEIKVYGHTMIPKVGDLTCCDGCHTTLEYTGEPTAVRLAPQWRVDLLNDADSVPANPRLSELVERARRKTVRLTDYYPPR